MLRLTNPEHLERWKPLYKWCLAEGTVNVPSERGHALTGCHTETTHSLYRSDRRRSGANAARASSNAVLEPR